MFREQLQAYQGVGLAHAHEKGCRPIFLKLIQIPHDTFLVRSQKLANPVTNFREVTRVFHKPHLRMRIRKLPFEYYETRRKC